MNQMNVGKVFSLILTLALILGAAACSGNGPEQAEAAAEQAREVARLRQENQELPKLREENQEVQRLRKENQDLAKLRSQYQEVLKLRKENEQLRNQLSRAQKQVQPPK